MGCLRERAFRTRLRSLPQVQHSGPFRARILARPSISLGASSLTPGLDGASWHRRNGSPPHEERLTAADAQPVAAAVPEWGCTIRASDNQSGGRMPARPGRWRLPRQPIAPDGASHDILTPDPRTVPVVRPPLGRAPPPVRTQARRATRRCAARVTPTSGGRGGECCWESVLVRFSAPGPLWRKSRRPPRVCSAQRHDMRRVPEVKYLGALAKDTSRRGTAAR
jgi:hypothetical protein